MEHLSGIFSEYHYCFLRDNLNWKETRNSRNIRIEPQHSRAQDHLVLFQDYSLLYILVLIVIHFVSLKMFRYDLKSLFVIIFIRAFEFLLGSDRALVQKNGA